MQWEAAVVRAWNSGGRMGGGGWVTREGDAPASGPAAARGGPRGGDAEIQAGAAARDRRPLHCSAGRGAASARRSALGPRGPPYPGRCSPGEVQHGFHHVRAVLGAGLAEQAVMGLERDGWNRRPGEQLRGSPPAAATHRGQPLSVGRVDPRRLRQRGPQVALITHQHERQCGPGALRQRRVAWGPAVLLKAARPEARPCSGSRGIPPVTSMSSIHRRTLRKLLWELMSYRSSTPWALRK